MTCERYQDLTPFEKLKKLQKMQEDFIHTHIIKDIDVPTGPEALPNQVTGNLPSPFESSTFDIDAFLRDNKTSILSVLYNNPM